MTYDNSDDYSLIYHLQMASKASRSPCIKRDCEHATLAVEKGRYEQPIRRSSAYML